MPLAAPILTPLPLAAPAFPVPLEDLGWLRPEAVWDPDGGRPSVRLHTNPRLAMIAAEAARGRRTRKASR